MKKTLITLLALSGLAMGEDVAISQLWDFSSSMLPAEGTTSTITVKDATELVTTTITGSNILAGDAWVDGGTGYVSGLDELIGIDGVEDAGQSYLTTSTGNSNIAITISGLTAGNVYDIALITGDKGGRNGAWGNINSGNVNKGTIKFINNANGKWGSQAIQRYNPTGVFIDGIEADENGTVTLTITQTSYSHATINALAITGTVTVPGDNVPEPTTATLSLLALAGLAARRRRR